jgi:uncharacterized protein (TIGR00251 family)
MSWFTSRTDGLLISVCIVPKSSRTGVCGIYGESLKIKIAAAPENGKANKELIDFLSNLLETSRQAITIVSGHTSRKKMLKIKGIKAADLERKIKV